MPLVQPVSTHNIINRSARLPFDSSSLTEYHLPDHVLVALVDNQLLKSTRLKLPRSLARSATYLKIFRHGATGYQLGGIALGI